MLLTTMMPPYFICVYTNLINIKRYTNDGSSKTHGTAAVVMILVVFFWGGGGRQKFITDRNYGVKKSITQSILSLTTIENISGCYNGNR